jgi:hypothetical protein
MNCGFSNLATLKANLLAPALVTSTDFDARITTLGLGVAAQFANYCNRKFDRAVNAQEIFAADRVRFLLSRFPVESVSLVELKLAESTGWQQLDAPPWNILQTIDTKSGIIVFPNGNDVGPDYAQVRITFTGGFWWPVLDSGDAGYPDTIPAGANALPYDLIQAWLTQCRNVWNAMDKIGDKITEVGSNVRQPSEVIAGLDLAPAVKLTLNNFARYSFT